MKTIVWPIIIFVAGLLIAHFLFGVDIERLAKGFFDFVSGILRGRG